MKIYIDVSKIKIFQMELLENFMAKNDIEYARIYTIESIDERDKEIERLTLSYEDALEDLDKKENIIKEVREYLKFLKEHYEELRTNPFEDSYFINDMLRQMFIKQIECYLVGIEDILDKENK